MAEISFLKRLKELLEGETGSKFEVDAKPDPDLFQWKIACTDRGPIGGICQYRDGTVEIYPPGKGEIGDLIIETEEDEGVDYSLKKQLHNPENWERLRDRFPKTVGYLQGLKSLAERVSREEGVRLEFWIDGDDYGYVALPELKAEMSEDEKLEVIRRHVKAFLRYKEEKTALWKSVLGSP